uniref:Aldehyde dehydrogenase domain-containing protein n=1 Tax=Glossina pallidipes TaxID=7398 RepID=A0A1A9ZHH6_GLOPL
MLRVHLKELQTSQAWAYINLCNGDAHDDVAPPSLNLLGEIHKVCTGVRVPSIVVLYKKLRDREIKAHPKFLIKQQEFLQSFPQEVLPPAPSHLCSLNDSGSELFVPRPRWKFYINGEWVEANDGERYEIKNPAGGEIIRCVPNMKIEDFQKAIEAAKCAFHSKE